MSKFEFTDQQREKIGHEIEWYRQSESTLYNYSRTLGRIEQIISERDGWGEEWQKCPKCDGQGIVSRPPWIAGDVFTWSSTEITHQCNVCNGAMIIPSPPKTKQ